MIQSGTLADSDVNLQESIRMLILTLAKSDVVNEDSPGRQERRSPGFEM